MTIGEEFEQGTVALHLTVLPRFRVSQKGSPAAISTIIALAAKARPITATATDLAHFGRAGDVRVTTIQLSAELRSLHLELLKGMHRAGATPLEPAHNDGGYRPHITHTREGRAIRPGERVELRQLAVLDCTEPIRRISATAPLSESADQPSLP